MSDRLEDRPNNTRRVIDACDLPWFFYGPSQPGIGYVNVVMAFAGTLYGSARYFTQTQNEEKGTGHRVALCIVQKNS